MGEDGERWYWERMERESRGDEDALGFERGDGKWITFEALVGDAGGFAGG